MPISSCHVKWRRPCGVGHVAFSSRINEKLNDSKIAPRRSEMKRRQPIIISQIWIGPSRKKRRDHISLSFLGSEMDGSDSAHRLDADYRALREQYSNYRVTP